MKIPSTHKTGNTLGAFYSEKLLEATSSQTSDKLSSTRGRMYKSPTTLLPTFNVMR